ncbi:MAG TPA: AI-2E family transporter [Planctomycetaceae bacterium]|nr:AI-2E family transporter [Planctomycetaceae bacterium]
MAQMARVVSLLLMGAVIVLLGLTFYQVIAPFLMPLFLAGVLAILCQPIHRRFLAWTKNRTMLAAALTTALVMAVVLVPLALGTVAAAKQLYSVAHKTLKGSDWIEAARFVETSAPFESAVRRYEDWTGEEVDRAELERDIQAKLRTGAATLAGKTLGYAGSTLSLLGIAISIVVGLLTFVIAFYYFLADGPALIQATEKLIPVHRDYKRHLLAQFDQAVRAVVSATFAAALAQGIATGVGMQIAGFRHFFIVTILATLTALVPVLGTWLIWGPYVLWLGFHDGRWGMAVFLILYGVVFVGFLDNVIRAYVLHTNVKLHPLLAFVSVLGGIEVMGLWGVFIGPIVASCLHALIKIFNTELVAFSQERETRASLDPDLSTLVFSGAAESKSPTVAVASPTAVSPMPAVVAASPAAPPASHNQADVSAARVASRAASEKQPG